MWLERRMWHAEQHVGVVVGLVFLVAVFVFCLPACGQPVLVLTKTVRVTGDCPGAPTAETPEWYAVTYCYRVENTGDAAAYNVLVCDDNGTPADTGDDFVVVLSGLSELGGGSGKDLVGIGGVATGEARVAMLTPGMITAQAAVWAEDSTLDPPAFITGSPCNCGPGSSCAAVSSTTVTVTDRFPELELTKTVRVTGDCPGGPTAETPEWYAVTYCYRVENTGDADAYNVLVCDDNGTPADTGDDFVVTLTGLSEQGGGAGKDLRIGGVATGEARVGMLTPGVITAQAAVWAEDSTLDPPAFITGSPCNCGPGSSCAAVSSTTVTVTDRFPVLVLTKTAVRAPGPCPGTSTLTVGVGDDVFYCYRVENTGDADAYNVLVCDDNGTPADTGDDFVVTLSDLSEQGGGSGKDLLVDGAATGTAVVTLSASGDVTAQAAVWAEDSTLDPPAFVTGTPCNCGPGSSCAAVSSTTVTADGTPPTDPTPTSSSHTVNVWSNDTTVDIAISGASDPGGVDGFEVAWDLSATWTPTETKQEEETWSGGTFTATSEGNWYFHIATVDNFGNWTSGVDAGPFRIDTTAPSVPTGLAPASGTYTSDATPTLSWSASTDTGGSGLRLTDTYRYVVTGTPSREGYTANTAYTPTLAEGVFTWKVYARDDAGNSSAYTANTTLYIDTTPPTDPTPSSPSHAVGQPSKDPTVDIAVSGAADPLSNGVASGVDGFDTAWDKNPTWVATAAKDQEETWIGGTFTATSDGDWYFHVATVDNVGNWTSTETLGPFSIDTTPPQVADVTVSDPLITDADTPGDGTFVVTVEFNEPMDTSVAPTLSFDPAVATTLWPHGDGTGWTDDHTYVALFDVADGNVDHDSVTIDATGTQDVAGNPQTDYAPEPEFEIDTLNPWISSITSATPDGYYNVGAAIDVTMNSSEAVTLTGTFPRLEVDLDSGAVDVPLAVPTGVASTNGTYTVGAGENSCDLNVVEINVSGPLRDAAGNDLNWDKTMESMTADNLADNNDIAVDTADPAIAWVQGFPSGTQDMDDDCSLTFLVEVLVEDNCCLDAADVTITVSDAADVTVTHTLTKTQADARTVRVEGDVTLSALTDGQATVDLDIDATDCCGNSDSANDAVTVVDDTRPTISGFTVTPEDGLVDGNCEEVVTVSGTIRDNCCLRSGHITSASATNASLKDASLWVVRTAWNEMEVSGTFTVHSLTGCPAVPSVEVSATDCGGLNATFSQNGTNIQDTSAPTFSAFTVTPADGVVDASCEEVVSYSVTVGDNCCIVPANITVTPSATNGSVKDLLVNKVPASGKTTQVVVSGTFTVHSLTGCPAVPSVEVSATDCCGQSSTTTQSGAGIQDMSAPTFSALTVTPADGVVDANCEEVVSYSVTVDDNCCIDAANIVITPSATNGSVKDLLVNKVPASGKTTQVVVSGTFTVHSLTGCPVVPSVEVSATDCCGQSSTTMQSGAEIQDTTAPVFSVFTVTPTDGFVDANCEEVVCFSFSVHDNCCVDLDDPEAITASVSATNAPVAGLTWSADKAGLQSDFTVTGSFTVESLVGCPAVPTVAVRVTDLCDNEGTASQNGAVIQDTIAPVVHDLLFYTDATYTVRESDVYVDDCCGTRLYFAAYVTDNCCIRREEMSIGLFVATGNAKVVGGGAQQVQKGANRVDVTGYIDVACLTSCPARAEILINARDCCGNVVLSQKTPETEGLIWDTVEPIPRDDPRQDVAQDESAVIDPLVEVRRDGFGAYRLILREDTPVRIDVLANDADNCSCEDCKHPFDPCGGCEDCEGCCATMTVHAIVTPPAHGTATIEDGEGDCTGGSVVRYAPHLGYSGSDEFTYQIRDACGNASSEVATVYLEVIGRTAMEDVYLTVCADGSETFELVGCDLWIDSDDPDRIPFAFEVVGAPAHGVLSGDLQDIAYTAQGATTEALGTAAVELTHTPAIGFVGHDSATVRFADPFGGFTDARVDIAVVECGPPVATVVPIPLPVGATLSIIVPTTFGVGGEVVTLVTADGVPVSGSVDVAWDAAVGRFVVTLDGEGLLLGMYVLTIPLGNGETVELKIEVGEAE